MEFEGRISRVLPVRSGTSQNGNEWKRLPFVFAYYESGEQRWEDKVLLETWDQNLMSQIGQYCVKGDDGKVVVENGSVKLNVLDIKCRCGFSHNVKDVKKRDGSGTVTMNELRCYRLEIMPAGNAAGTVAQQPQGAFGQAIAPKTQVVYPNPFQPQETTDDDDLPF